jgi:protocatechuate 3,4-dioxygenase beta subunit
VRCTLTGYLSQSKSVTLTAGVTTVVDFLMQSTAPPSPIVTGTVTDAGTAAPLAGALVEVLDGVGNLENSAVTNASGQYTINSGLTAGPAQVRCSLTGYVTQVKPATLTDGVTTTVDFQMQPQVAPSPIVSGTVTDASTSAPLQGALVEVLDGVGNLENSATTDASGHYTINSGLVPGPAQVRCSKSGYVTQTTPVTLTDGVTTTVDFALQPAPSPSPIVTGTVTDANTGLPLAGALVEVLTVGGVLENSATTDASGNYTINSGLIPGSAWVRCSLTGYLTQAKSVTLTSGVTTVVNFLMSPTGPSPKPKGPKPKGGVKPK